MKNSFITLAVLISFMMSGMGQGILSYNYPGDTVFENLKPQTHYFVETGAGFGSFWSNSKFNETYTRAGVSFSPVKKLNITTIAGISSQTYTFGSASSESGSSNRVDSRSQNIWIGGEYEFSKKISVKASFFYQKSIFDSQSLNPRATDFNQAGGTLDVKYKINSNLEINGGIHIIRGGYPSLFNGFYNLDRGQIHRGFLSPW